MKMVRKILLSVLCISLLSLTAFIGYRNAVAEAQMDRVKNYRPDYEYTDYIEYKGVRYYKNDDFLPGQYRQNDLEKERLTYAKDRTSPFFTYSVYSYENDDIPDMLQLNSIWVSLGTIFIREDYILPTVKDSSVSSVEIQKYQSDETIVFNDEDTISRAVDFIKNHEDVSNLFSVEKYGNYSLYLHYDDAPVYELIGSISQTDGKFEYFENYRLQIADQDRV